MKLTIHSEKNTQVIAAQPEESIFSVLARAGGASLHAPCGGHGKCGKCLLPVRGAVTDADGNILRLTVPTPLPACRATLAGDCEVWLSPEAALLVSMDAPGAPTETDLQGLGAAIDIGTTTLAVFLYDGPRLLGRLGQANRQGSFGADVISRIHCALERPDGLEALRDTLRGQLLSMLGELCRAHGAALRDLRQITAVGNTVMLHFLTGLPVDSLAVAPFAPVSLFGDTVSGLWPGLDAALYLPPAIAGYLGSDVTAGLLDIRETPALFCDIGTNGELALLVGDTIYCCAAAAGPAFEGAEIDCGMAAAPGAIDAVWWDGGPRFSVIGGGAPRGLCGSGLLDALAMLRRLDAVDESGYLFPPDKAPREVSPYLEKTARDVRFVLSDTVYFSAGDVRKLQLAKAALMAGADALLHTAGLSWEDIQTTHLAGGFGSVLNPQSARDIGFSFPHAVAAGNTAGLGAQKLLLSCAARRQVNDIAARCRVVELAGNPVFQNAFMERVSL